METVTKTRKNVRNKIGLKGARSYSSLRRLNMSLRGYEIEHLQFIIAIHGTRFVPIFQEYGLFQEQVSELQALQFRTA